MFANNKAFSGFSVNSLERAREFYGKSLGLAIEEKPGLGIVVRLGGNTPLFIYEKPNHEPATYTVLNFRVENIEKAVDELVARGIVMERYPSMNQDERGIDRKREGSACPSIAWFKDPAGNILSVVED